MNINSKELAKYIEDTSGISKPWLLLQLRLKKLEEQRMNISSQEYLDKLDDIQKDLLKLGKWWQK